MAQVKKQLDYIRDRYGTLETYVVETYGPQVPFSEVGDFCLIHLDSPSEAEIRRRVDEFDVNDHFPDDCPICEMQKEMGGFIVYDGEDGSEEINSEAHDEPLGHEIEENLEGPNIPEDSVWRRSYLNMESLREASPDLRVNMLLMHLWGNIVELREDLENEAADPVKLLSTEFKVFVKNVQLLLMMPDKIIPCNEMKPSFERVKRLSTDINNAAAAKKIVSFCQMLDLFGESVQELLIHRSLLRN